MMAAHDATQPAGVPLQAVDLPLLRELTVHGPLTSAGAPLTSWPADLQVVEGASPGPAWDALANLDPAHLPAEGYALRTATTPDGPRAWIAVNSARGLRYGRQTLRALMTSPPRAVSVRDWPELEIRGTIEGFYGPPWTHQDRLDHVVFAARHRLNSYVYAPKDDPYHRERWRDPYPEAELAALREIVTAADASQVDLVYALAPGLTMRHTDDAEHGLLAAKAEQLRAAGVRRFALLFDDIPTELRDATDVAVFGAGPGGAGAAHGRTCARFAAALGPGPDLIMVPTDYGGRDHSPYREHLDRELPADIAVWWTGSDVVVGEVTRADIDAAADSFRRRLLLWDNFPVNDFDRSRLFLGPLRGRTTDVAGSALLGISANPMIEAAASQLALATVAEWAWNPSAYDPAAAAARALVAVAGPLSARIAPLVAACSSWPPSAAQSPELTRLVDAALDGDWGAAADLGRALRDLAAVPPLGAATRLAEQLEPWADAGAAMARAGLAGLAVLELLETHAVALEAGVALARSALAEAEDHHAAVLRDVVPRFVRRVLDRAAAGPGIS